MFLPLDRGPFASRERSQQEADLVRGVRRILYLLVGLNAFVAVELAILLWGNVPVVGRSIGSLASVLQRARPAVVTLRVTGEKAIPVEVPPRAGNGESRIGQPSKEVVRTGGSGVIVDAREGHILTNNHVVEHATQIDVGIADGRHLPARLLGRDPGTDLALLKVEPKELPSIRIGNSDRARVGDVVVAVGSPFGLEGTATMGIVSAVMRTEIGHETFEDYFQIDAQINRGNSGGALVNAKGELIGINTVIAGGRGQAFTIGFAIPINMAMTIHDEIKRHGRMQRGFTGLIVRDFPNEGTGSIDGIHAGAVVDRVIPGTPTAAQNIKPGDIIIQAGGKPVRNAAEFMTRASLVPVWSHMPILLFSEGKRRHLRLAVTAAAMEPEKHILPERLGSAGGLTVGEILPGNPRYGTIRGVQLLDVPQTSPGYAAGLEPGDVLVSVDDARVTSVNELIKRIEQAALEYRLDIMRGGSPAWVRMKR